MIGRFIEDAYVAGRFVWFYSQAPKRMNAPGFGPRVRPTARARARWAWDMTTGRLR